MLQVGAARASPAFFSGEGASETSGRNLSAVDHYARFEEIGAGRGYADMLFLPVAGSEKPALIIELKKDASPQAAIDQIKTKRHVEVLERFRHHGAALLVGIAFDPKNNRHRCRIESAEVGTTVF